MGDRKERALAKMLEEMNKEHTAAEDRIHVWLCNQEDDALFENILKEGKSISGALRYAKELARKEASNGIAVIEDNTVYEWVVEYFASDKSEPKPVPTRKLGVAEEKAILKRQEKTRLEAEEKARKEAEKAHKAELKKAGAVEGQMAIFDLL